MYSLIIDSATKILYIALVKDNNLLEDIYITGSNDHAKNKIYLRWFVDMDLVHILVLEWL